MTDLMYMMWPEMPNIMDNLLPHMLPDVAPLVVPKMIVCLRGRA